MEAKSCSRQENEKWQDKDRERIRQQILAHADALAEEMNLRLFLWGETVPWIEDKLLQGILAQAGEHKLWWELCGPQRIFFVESITVKDIVFPGSPANESR